MRARVPASTANLGPGFDALALALELYVEVEIEPHDGPLIVATGCGAHLTDPDHHLGFRVAADVLGHRDFLLRVHSEIPLARGLGSSAALALAAAAAAGANDPLAYAIEVDGHVENAAASRFGGLVVGAFVDGRAVVEPLPLDATLRFVVVIPDRELATESAREVLPTSVAFTDATFNLGRLGLLIAGLADHTRLTPVAMQDRLHQRYRGALLPFADELLEGLVGAGALASCWSGAGSTMLAVTVAHDAPALADAARSLLDVLHVDGEVRVLAADRLGLTTS